MGFIPSMVQPMDGSAANGMVPDLISDQVKSEWTLISTQSWYCLLGIRNRVTVILTMNKWGNPRKRERMSERDCFQKDIEK